MLFRAKKESEARRARAEVEGDATEAQEPAREAFPAVHVMLTRIEASRGTLSMAAQGTVPPPLFLRQDRRPSTSCARGKLSMAAEGTVPAIDVHAA